MKAKTEELLYLLMWTCEMIARPAFRNLTDSFESWAYRNGLMRQLAELERRKFLESSCLPSSEGPAEPRAVRLSELGKLHALGGRDPEAEWRRPWDGRWRVILFDLPNSQTALRDGLRRSLRKRGFGYLQNSAWITPNPWAKEQKILLGTKANVESLILLEALAGAGESDAEIVAGAWDFPAINTLYTRHRKVLATRPKAALDDVAAARALRKWAATERSTWLTAVTADPLLPEVLLPADYLGRIVWHERVQVLRQAAGQIREFNDPRKSCPDRINVR